MPLSLASMPVPVEHLLARLRYPRAKDTTGLAAWGVSEPAPGGMRRTNAWVKWNGATVQALLTDSPPGAPDRVLSLEWTVAPAGASSLAHAHDHAGPLEPGRALDTFAQALGRLGPPAFVAVDPAPALIRRTPSP